MTTKTKEKLIGSDAEYGYKFGCDGLMSLKQAAGELGIHKNSVVRFCDDGRLRGGKLPVANKDKDEKKGKRVVCRRSVQNLIELAKD